jgi:hypothetical protein
MIDAAQCKSGGIIRRYCHDGNNRRQAICAVLESLSMSTAHTFWTMHVKLSSIVRYSASGDQPKRVTCRTSEGDAPTPSHVGGEEFYAFQVS